MKYLELINQTAEETAKNNNKLVAEEADLSLQTAILNVKKEISQATTKIQVAKSAVPFRPEAVLAAHNEKALLERSLEYYNSLKQELF